MALPPAGWATALTALFATSTRSEAQPMDTGRVDVRASRLGEGTGDGAAAGAVASPVEGSLRREPDRRHCGFSGAGSSSPSLTSIRSSLMRWCTNPTASTDVSVKVRRVSVRLSPRLWTFCCGERVGELAPLDGSEGRRFTGVVSARARCTPLTVRAAPSFGVLRPVLFTLPGGSLSLILWAHSRGSMPVSAMASPTPKSRDCW
mmetsp:Transcript_77376/g.206561  ORF Transcript_77376/g.206561 Transcript_77376/m.206561 type:complete len:204 (-) Transcript_77376:1336-1947(-)